MSAVGAKWVARKGVTTGFWENVLPLSYSPLILNYGVILFTSKNYVLKIRQQMSKFPKVVNVRPRTESTSA